jgi:chromate transporter
VARRRWLSDDAYADLIALCQFLPGPASSQAAFALGMTRAGFPGAVAASLCFLLPSAAAMIAVAFGLDLLPASEVRGWVLGLQLAAVAVVAHAVLAMGRVLCPDPGRILLCLAGAAASLLLPGAWTQVAVIAACAAAGWLFLPAPTAPTAPASPVRGHRTALMALILFAVLLAAAGLAAGRTDSRIVAEFSAFYRSGSLVFGGGHVVLPLLRAELVPRGWISESVFLSGYGAAQAVPGPLFSFAGFLGAAMHPGTGAWAWGVWCLFALFLPAWLLVGGAMPFWQSLRRHSGARAALRGANAGVVGILLAALIHPIGSGVLTSIPTVGAGVLAFAALQFAKAPPWAVVLLLAAAGRYLLS